MQIEKQDAEIGVLSLAEKEGFEPSRRLSQPTPLAGEPLRPLGYFSMSSSYAVKKAGGERGIRTPGTVARTPHFECGPIDHSGTSPFRSREEDLPRSPDPKPLFWDCKYRHIFYFRTFSCGKNHIWLKKRLRRPCFCRFSGIIRTFDFVEDTPARQNAGKFAFAFAGSYLCKRTDPLRACSIFRARPFIKMNDTKTGTVFVWYLKN